MKIFVEDNDCTIERLLKMFRIAQLQIEYVLVSESILIILSIHMRLNCFKKERNRKMELIISYSIRGQTYI